MKYAALIFGDEQRQSKSAAGKSPEPGQIVRTIDGSVYRVASKIAGPDGVVVKLANLQGSPVQTPPNFRPVGLAVARFASWLRYHLAYNKDFDLYVNAYIEQYNNQHKKNPLPYPVGQDGKPFRWANFFQKKIAPKLFVRGHGGVEDQQAVKDDIIHEMLFNTLGERRVLDQFVSKAKNLGVNKHNAATKLTDFLISTFMYRIDEMQNKLNARSPEEEISMYQPGQTDEGEGEINILETEEHGVGGEDFQGAEARRDVARFRESFRKWLAHTAGPKASENFILMFDIFWRLLQTDEDADVKRSDLQEEWIEKTGLSFGSFKDYFTRLPEMMESFIMSHENELGEGSIFVELMNAIRNERTERERKERRQKQKARPATVSSLKVAEGVEEDVEEAAAATVSPMKVADGIGGDLAQAISNSENPDVVDPDIKQPTKTVPEAAKEAASKTAQQLLRGESLNPQQKQQVLNAFPYRWTKENPHRVTRECPNCDVRNNPFVGNSAAGHNHPVIPLQSDDEWVRDHAFWFTNAGRLFPNRSAQPASYAPEPEPQGLFASVAHRFAMDKSRKYADFACCGGVGEHDSACSVKGTDSPSGKHTGGVFDRYMTPNQMVQEFNRPGGQGERLREDYPVEEKEPHITTKMRRGLGEPAIERKEGMLGHDFNDADGQAIGNETESNTGRYLHESDTTELKERRMASHEVWECMDCGQKGELDPVGGGCATCGSQAIARVDQSKPADLTPIREPNPMEVEKRMIPRRERMISPGSRLSAADKTAQGSGNTTVTFQNQNVTSPNSPNKAEPMAVPEAIDQAAGPHSPNAPSTAPRTPGITPKIVNVPPGTEGESMGNMASAKTADGFEDLFNDLLSQYSCPKCNSMNVDVTPTEDGYDIYCEDCEQVTHSHGDAAPGVSGFHATEPEMPVDEDLEMEPEEPPFEINSSFVRTAAINVSQGQDDQGFHMNINMNGREYVLRGQDADNFRREYAAIPKPEGKVNALVEKYLNKLQPYGAAPKPRPAAPKPQKHHNWGIPEWLKRKEREEAQAQTASKTADALFEEQPLKDVTDLNVLLSLSEERKAEWLKAHGWSPDESWHGPAWWLRQPQWTKDGREEDIPYQGTDEAIEKEIEIQEKDDEYIESKGIGCRECGAVLNNGEGDLCPQCQAEGVEDREDPFEHMSADEEGEDKMQVAKTILEQLGGNKFRAMTGAKNFVGSANSLSFTLPGAGGFTKNGINRVLIQLTPNDTYRVNFSRVRAGKISWQSNHDDVYAENLREVFERETGLATSLGASKSLFGAGSNSGEDDPRGVGTNYNDEFYEHRTEGLSSDGMLSGMKEAAPVALNAPAPAPLPPNVQQNMNIVRPQVPGQPAGTEVAITPSGGNMEETNVGKHTVEPELPNSKYHMMGSLVAAEENRLAAEAGYEVDPEAEANPDMYTAEEKAQWIPPQGTVCRNCEQPKPDLKWYVFDEFSDLKPGREGKDLEGWFCKDCAIDTAQDI